MRIVVVVTATFTEPVAPSPTVNVNEHLPASSDEFGPTVDALLSVARIEAMPLHVDVDDVFVASGVIVSETTVS